MEEVNIKVEKALKALEDYASYDQEKIDYIVAKCSVAALDKHGELAKLAIEETQRGVFEDKATKNLFACEYVVNHMRNQKTVGKPDYLCVPSKCAKLLRCCRKGDV